MRAFRHQNDSNTYKNLRHFGEGLQRVLLADVDEARHNLALAHTYGVSFVLDASLDACRLAECAYELSRWYLGLCSILEETELEFLRTPLPFGNALRKEAEIAAQVVMAEMIEQCTLNAEFGIKPMELKHVDHNMRKNIPLCPKPQSNSKTS